MKVWVVSAGWAYEGANIQGIFNTQDKAIHYKDVLLKQDEYSYDFIDITAWDVE